MKEISNSEYQDNNKDTLSEKDNLNIVLSYLKDITKNYLLASTELSNDTLYKPIIKATVELSNLQRKVYEKAFKYGWYKLETVNNTKINKLYNTLSKELNNLN